MFSKKTLLRGKSVDNRPLVDLYYWAKNTYPEAYSSMTELDQEGIDYLNSVKGTYMGSMFRDCGSLTSLDVSNWDTSNATDMGSMFRNCSSLTSLDVSNWDTSIVANMSRIFEYCSSLTSLDLSNWNTSNVTDMLGMFTVCSSLTSLDLSNWNTSNVTDMCGMFYRCSSLTSLDLSNCDTSNVTDMSTMFSGCSLLEYLIIGSATFKFQMIDSRCGRLNTTCTILVPSALLDTYKTATNWSSRSSQFDAIENYTIKRSNGQVTVTPK